MAKYEILTIVNGSLTEQQVKEELTEGLKLISKSDSFKETDMGLRTLAYEIAGCEKGWYSVFNFNSTNSEAIIEFNRITKLNKKIIRTLIINLDKDYGARALNNPIKIRRSEMKKKNYDQKMVRFNEERKTRDEAHAKLFEINSSMEVK